MSAICLRIVLRIFPIFEVVLKAVAVFFTLLCQVFSCQSEIIAILRTAEEEDLDRIVLEHTKEIRKYHDVQHPDMHLYHGELIKFRENCLVLKNAYLNQLIDYYMLLSLMQLENKLPNIQQKHRPMLLKLQNSEFLKIRIYGLMAEGQFFCIDNNIGCKQELLLRAYHSAIKNNLKNSFLFNLVNLALVDVYFQFDDYPNIIKHALELTQSHYPGANIKLESFNKVGYCFTLMNEHEKALSNFYSMLDLVKTLKPSEYHPAWPYIAHGNIGRILLEQSKFTQAIEHLTLDFKYSCSNQIWDCGIPSGIRLMKSYTALKQYDKSGEVFNELSKVAFNGNSIVKFDYYKTVAQYLGKIGKTIESNRYFDSAIQAQINMQNEQAKAQLTLNKNKIQVEKYMSELEIAGENIKLKTKIRNILIFVLIVIIVAAILIFYSLKMNARRKKEILELELQLTNIEMNKLESENSKMKSKLESVIQDLKEKSLKIEKFEARITNKNNAKNKEILTKMHLSTDENWYKFRQQFKTIHPDFINEISEELPEITAGEIRYLCLLKLALEPFEIANLLGISKESVQKIKQRLKNKLNNDQAIQIGALINNMNSG